MSGDIEVTGNIAMQPNKSVWWPTGGNGAYIGWFNGMDKTFVIPGTATCHSKQVSSLDLITLQPGLMIGSGRATASRSNLFRFNSDDCEDTGANLLLNTGPYFDVGGYNITTATGNSLVNIGETDFNTFTKK